MGLDVAQSATKLQSRARLLLLLLVMLQGLMLWHDYQHPIHSDSEPPCVIHQLGSQLASPPAVLAVAMVLFWWRSSIANVAALLLPFALPRHGASRAPPARHA